MALMKIQAGSIICYAGIIDEAKKTAFETKGWLVCDGSSFTFDRYPDLYAAIGGVHGHDDVSFNVPDLRENFIRGVDADARIDPEAKERKAPKPGGNAGALVGSFQGDATAIPVKPFVSNLAGEHTHDLPHLPPDDYHRAYAGSHGRAGGKETGTETITGDAGAHTHAIINGGDDETSPIHMSLNYLIKHRNS